MEYRKMNQISEWLMDGVILQVSRSLTCETRKEMATFLVFYHVLPSGKLT